jgi:hypothetical protein
MKNSVLKVRNRELVIEYLGAPASAVDLEALPTVCLVLSDDLIQGEVLRPLLVKVLEEGGVYFMSYGAAAEAIHDQVDEVLEEGPDEWLDIPSSSHQEETPDDVASFLMNAAHPTDGPFRCHILVNGKPQAAGDTLSAIRRIFL